MSDLPIGKPISLPGHFDVRVILEAARPLARGSRFASSRLTARWTMLSSAPRQPLRWPRRGLAGEVRPQRATSPRFICGGRGTRWSPAGLPSVALWCRPPGSCLPAPERQAGPTAARRRAEEISGPGQCRQVREIPLPVSRRAEHHQGSAGAHPQSPCRTALDRAGDARHGPRYCGRQTAAPWRPRHVRGRLDHPAGSPTLGLRSLCSRPESGRPHHLALHAGLPTEAWEARSKYTRHDPAATEKCCNRLGCCYGGSEPPRGLCSASAENAGLRIELTH